MVLFRWMAVICGLVVCSGALRAQDKGFDLHMHANSDKTTAADVGLPVYAGAVMAKSEKNDSNSADMGFAFGDFKIAIKVAKYETGDPGWKVFGFYRTALGKYGQVLECDHGKPVGSLTKTSSGLTCSADSGKKGNLNWNGEGSSSDSHELRAGTPHQFRVVGLDKDKQASGKTVFALVYIELPRDKDVD